LQASKIVAPRFQRSRNNNLARAEIWCECVGFPPFGGVAQRFQDLPLHPHTWLHLTVTNGSTDRYVNVHFDAITTEGQRLFIAEAPYELQTPTQAVKKHGKRADN
jgi:hypothetical protein